MKNEGEKFLFSFGTLLRTLSSSNWELRDLNLKLCKVTLEVDETLSVPVNEQEQT